MKIPTEKPKPNQKPLEKDNPIEVQLTAKNKTSQSYLIRKEKGLLVARTETGQIYTKKKLQKGDYIPDLITQLKQTGTFEEDTEKQRLAKVYEIARSPSEFKKRSYKDQTAFYFRVSITFNSGRFKGQTVHAQSKKFYNKADIEYYRDQAMESLYQRVDELINGGDSYDVDKGKEALIPYDYDLTRRVVYYKNA